MVFARVVLDEYANKVLNVVKAQFGLKDKSEAINKFIGLYGLDIVEKEATDQYVKKVLSIEQSHMKKYGKRRMTLKELDALCEA